MFIQGGIDYMKVIKNINNNIAICQDSTGRAVIVFAKGIGFKKPPYEVPVKDIQRTFYDVDPRYLELIQKADETIIDIAIEIKNDCDRRNIVTSPNLLFSLIDHITFALHRCEQGIYFNLPISQDIQHMFPEEFKAGRYGLELIQARKQKTLPKEEAAYIAMNIINSEKEVSDRQKKEDEQIHEVCRIIEESLNFKIDEEGISYSRFVSHMRYWFKVEHHAAKSDDYAHIFETVKETYPEEVQAARQVKDYLEGAGLGPLTEDDVLFITMHINRLRRRENAA
jgi:beta-glucoside operon transcriptional antiterminator